MGLKFSFVSKAHGLCAMFFGLVFLLATCGLNIPVIGPAALLKGWDDSTPALVYVSRFLAGFMLGLGYYEFEFCHTELAKKLFVRYHIVLALLVLYSTLAVSVGLLSWLYGAIVTLFLVAALAATDEGYASI